MLNRKKQGIIIPKSYIVGNAIIRAKKVDNRKIVDEEDINRLFNLVKYRLNNKGMAVSILDDIKSGIYEDEFISGKVEDIEYFMALPQASDEDLMKFREDLPFGLEEIFTVLDSDENLERDSLDLELLKNFENEISSKYKDIPVKKEKTYLKKYVSQK